MKKNNLLICCLLLLFYTVLNAQNPNKRGFFDTNFQYEFEINHANKKIKLREEKKYYWYKLNKIHTNFYDNSGKMLHGNYQKYKIRTLELVEKGTFYYGLKDGLWKKWYVNGRLKQKENWKKGVLHGKYITYNENGEKLIKGYYKNGKKDGIWIDFQKNDTIKYNNDIIKDVKLKSKKIKSVKKFFNFLFRKKNDSTNSKSPTKKRIKKKKNQQKNRK